MAKKKPLDLKHGTVRTDRDPSGGTGRFALKDGKKTVAKVDFKKVNSRSINGAANAIARTARSTGRSIRVAPRVILRPEDEEDEEEGSWVVRKIAHKASKK